jgi:hypothetical protein
MAAVLAGFQHGGVPLVASFGQEQGRERRSVTCGLAEGKVAWAREKGEGGGVAATGATAWREKEREWVSRPGAATRWKRRRAWPGCRRRTASVRATAARQRCSWAACVCVVHGMFR